MKIEFTVTADPRPKGRPRLGRYGNIFTPKKPIAGAVKLTVTFYKKKTKKLVGKYVTKRPDLDNYLKLIIDSMNEWFWLDDSQIAEIHASKKYGLIACTEVCIETEDIDEKPKEKWHSPFPLPGL
jgi:hypothetical protein